MFSCHIFSARFAAHDGNMGARLQRQSLSHLIADICHIRVRLRRAEDDLSHRSAPAGKEHPPHQAPNLLACKVLRIPIVRLAKTCNLRHRCFCAC